MPSAASRYGIFATDAAEAIMPCSSRPCIGFAPGANPMHGRDEHGIMASAASVAKIPYRDAADGISLTTTMVPQGLGRTSEDQISNLVGVMDAFFDATGYHLNINVLNRATLLLSLIHISEPTRLL